MCIRDRLTVGRGEAERVEGRQTAILQAKLRDLELAQFRMAAPLAALTAGYRNALAGYLGRGGEVAPPPPARKHAPVASKKASPGDTLKRLDALDAQRRTVESARCV